MDPSDFNRLEQGSCRDAREVNRCGTVQPTLEAFHPDRSISRHAFKSVKISHVKSSPSSFESCRHIAHDNMVTISAPPTTASMLQLRDYQYEMYELSLRENIVVAVMLSPFATHWITDMAIRWTLVVGKLTCTPSPALSLKRPSCLPQTFTFRALLLIRTEVDRSSAKVYLFLLPPCSG